VKPRLYGINHVALEVDDLGRAVDFWRAAFDVHRVDYEPGGAFVDLGDQFVALFERSADTQHFGLVVDDKEVARESLRAAGAEILPGRFLDARDPFGNRIQIVQYDRIRFTKDAGILQALGLPAAKTDAALQELREQGLLRVRDAALRWADGWARAWAKHDVELVASLYAEGASFRSAFFRDEQPPGDYAAWAFSDEAGAEVWFAEPLVEGDRAAVPWWGISHLADGSHATLAGVSRLWFDGDGLVVRQLDYWNEHEGVQRPPDDWGPVAAHAAS
jgi:catechol 2,3-dioxygenase-like lactoylglutathione lyase family enzyme